MLRNRRKHTQTHAKTYNVNTHGMMAEIDLWQKTCALFIQTKVRPSAPARNTHDLPTCVSVCVLPLQTKLPRHPFHIHTNERKRPGNLFCNYSPRSEVSARLWQMNTHILHTLSHINTRNIQYDETY